MRIGGHTPDCLSRGGNPLSKNALPKYLTVFALRNGLFAPHNEERTTYGASRPWLYEGRDCWGTIINVCDIILIGIGLHFMVKYDCGLWMHDIKFLLVFLRNQVYNAPFRYNPRISKTCKILPTINLDTKYKLHHVVNCKNYTLVIWNCIELQITIPVYFLFQQVKIIMQLTLFKCRAFSKVGKNKQCQVRQDLKKLLCSGLPSVSRKIVRP